MDIRFGIINSQRGEHMDIMEFMKLYILADEDIKSQVEKILEELPQQPELPE